MQICFKLEYLNTCLDKHIKDIRPWFVFQLIVLLLEETRVHGRKIAILSLSVARVSRAEVAVVCEIRICGLYLRTCHTKDLNMVSLNCLVVSVATELTLKMLSSNCVIVTGLPWLLEDYLPLIRAGLWSLASMTWTWMCGEGKILVCYHISTEVHYVQMKCLIYSQCFSHWITNSHVVMSTFKIIQYFLSPYNLLLMWLPINTTIVK